MVFLVRSNYTSNLWWIIYIIVVWMYFVHKYLLMMWILWLLKFIHNFSNRSLHSLKTLICISSPFSLLCWQAIKQWFCSLLCFSIIKHTSKPSTSFPLNDIPVKLPYSENLMFPLSFFFSLGNEKSVFLTPKNPVSQLKYVSIFLWSN